ncbi:glycoside hydrolase family 2 TIM barrel-domain containing protein [Bifidobacterium simiiventris]|uniref:glycoside hydrolase family 2 TIM barrel-domain containing protein n=1 Tax=Bifidobacterium simiiventris TaxID=2834434 RepID=UPI001C5A4DB6|nr:glycoside hydrolase family 2 TIM barrel-domain containing protein [Bifidobacterium simiiventris]MBW3079147.1 DUF4982 domain-containing protein [Bifidobacterium simiiventris]
MKAVDFNHGWAYRHLDATGEPFEPVTLPHDAMLGEPRSPFATSGVNSGWFEGRDYEYVKRFTPGEDLAGCAMILEFEGVYHDAEVWIDGELAASCPYGYSDFAVDVTDRFAAGHEHEIRVIARNADQPNSRWYSGAGIYRPVTLWVGPRDHIAYDGVSVRTLGIGAADGSAPARVRFAVETTAPGTVSVEAAAIGASSGVTLPHPASPGAPSTKGAEASAGFSSASADVSSSTASAVLERKANTAVIDLAIPDPRLWSPDEPNLYIARIRYESANINPNTAHRDADEATVTFGIRTLAWNDRGFQINGKRVIIQGACVHHDNGVLGACAYADAEERKVALLKRAGYNAIRSAHNPCSKALLAAADRLGMLVMDEYIDHWYIHKTQHDYVDRFRDHWRADLASMVAKDRNHPSVVMYSIGNEVSETAQPRGIRLARAMTEHLHRLDPTRPVTCGINIFFNFLSSIGLGFYSDSKAAKEAAKAERLRRRGKLPGRRRLVGSEFFNKLTVVLGARVMKRAAVLPPCDWVTRGAFAQLDIAGYNYGIERYLHDLRTYPHRLILGSETFCEDAYRFRELAKRHPRVIGDFVWAGMDYMGEAGIGSWEYEDYAPLRIGFGWLTAGSGRLDLTGRPLGEALYTRVALEAGGDRGPYIAVRPVNHTDDKHSPSAWKMTDAMPSWSWNGCDGRLAHVEVYVRAASVLLLVNGREVGRRVLRDDCVARFVCAYRPGVIEAVAYDKAGREIGRRSLRSANDHTELRATVEWPVGGWMPETDDRLIGGSADGRIDDGQTVGLSAVAPGHLAFVRVRYTDDHGTVKPLERGLLHARVTGGRLLGFGCAAPYNRGSFVTGETGTYYGEALAVVQVPEDARPGDTVVLNVADEESHTAKVVIGVA